MKKAILHIAGILVLLFAGIYNLFPLVTPDTGTYLNSAFDFQVPQDRTVFYSLFIKIFSLKISLWLIVIAQATLLYYLLYQFITTFFSQYNDLHKLIIILGTTVFTSVSWFTSQLMPDIFTSIVCLSAILFLFSTDSKKSILYAGILFFAITTHNSHLIISVLFIVLLSLLSFFINHLKTLRKKFALLFLISIMAWSAVIATNLFAGYGFTASKVSHVFLIAKLSENGILKAYLDDNCDKTNYKLCPYKDELPNHGWDFIWSSDGAFSESGGWTDSKKEYDAILKGTFTKPKYIKMHIIESLKASKIQFTLTYVGDGLGPHINGENPSSQVQNFFKKEYNRYLSSKQNTGMLSFEPISKLYHYFFLFSLLTFPFLFIKKGNQKLKVVYLLILLFVILNAFVTASFANILGRLNSRAIWLFPFINSMILIQNIRDYLIRYKKLY